VVEPGHDEDLLEDSRVHGRLDLLAKDALDSDVAAGGAMDAAADGGEGAALQLRACLGSRSAEPEVGTTRCEKYRKPI